MVYDCIVLGLGGMGSSVMRHLARRGTRVLGIEQFGPVHDRGSSHGQTRIIRKAYFEHPDYVPLLHRSYELWEELQSEWGRPLFRPCGVLLAGRDDGQAIPGSLRSAQDHGLDVACFDASEARDHFPWFRFTSDQTVVLEQAAGCLFVEDCVKATLDSAVRSGAVARFHEQVHHWTANASEVTVKTSQGSYSGRRLVITPGAWGTRLLAQAIPPLEIRKKVQLWFAAKDQAIPLLSKMPAFYFETADGAFYGIPEPDSGQVKVARHSGGEIVGDLDKVSQVSTQAEEREILDFVTETLPDLTGHPVRSSPCLYSMSPDSHFLIDRHPDHDNVLLAAGFSGHGFKFATVVGEALGDLVLHDQTALPIAFLGLDRLSHQ